MGFVRQVLGAEAHECFRGVIDNRPGSLEQDWHADWREWDEEQSGQEARRLTCFIPLVDLDDPACGATQYFPGSHTQPVDTARDRAWVTPTPARGSVLAFDYRLVHRGGGNTRPPGGASRPMMHIVYARRGYAGALEREAPPCPTFLIWQALCRAPSPYGRRRATRRCSRRRRRRGCTPSSWRGCASAARATTGCGCTRPPARRTARAQWRRASWRRRRRWPSSRSSASSAGARRRTARRCRRCCRRLA